MKSDRHEIYYKGTICKFFKVRDVIERDSFGDLALLYAKPRTAAVFAKSKNVVLASLHYNNYKKIFKGLLESDIQREKFFRKIFPY